MTTAASTCPACGTHFPNGSQVPCYGPIGAQHPATRPVKDAPATTGEEI